MDQQIRYNFFLTVQRLGILFEVTMPDIVNQIESFSFLGTQLFFDFARLGEEATLNLASFPFNEAGFTAENVNLMIGVLQKAIARMENTLSVVWKNKRAVFYMWSDRHANLLRWSILSDLGQPDLPFSSNFQEVDIRTVVREWSTPMDDSTLLSINEIELMPTAELRNITRAMGPPSINVYVRRVPGVRKTRTQRKKERRERSQFQS